MTDENKEILEKVKSLVSEKKIVQKKKETKTSKDSSYDQLAQKEIERWIDQNAEKIAREIINDNLKKVLK